MNPIHRMAAEAAFKKMFVGGHFSICVIRELNTLTGNIPDKEAINILSLLHCVNFSDMRAELRAELPSLIRRAIGLDGFDIEDILRPEPEHVRVTSFNGAPKRGMLGLLSFHS